MTETSTHDIAAAVRAEVARRGLRQSVVAAHIGLNQQAVSRRLLGQTQWTASEIRRVAELLEVPVGVLLGEVPV